MATKISGKTGATAGVGTVTGAGLAPLIVWILNLNGIDIDPATAAVLGGLIGQVASFLIAWLVPAKSGKYVDTEPWVYEPADNGDSAEEDIDWTDGAEGGMAAYASDQTPKIEGA